MKVALAGDTMLGRKVADRLAAEPPESLFAPEVIEFAGAADLFVLNLECCISERGRPWPDPRKPFFFRAPPAAVEALTHVCVDGVTVANNHALDFQAEALLDTLHHLAGAGIAAVGAGRDVARARAPVVLAGPNGFRLGVVGASDHPEDFAAAPGRPGIAHADLRSEVPTWLAETVARVRAEADAVLVTPHWGPNMNPDPLPYVRAAAAELLDAGATLVAGHSAHVFQGVEGPVLYDLGDFLDDYAVDPVLRNDLGLLWVVELDEHGPIRLEAMPLKLEFCFTRAATGEDAAWIRRRLREACAAFGTAVREEGDVLVIGFPPTASRA